MSSFTSKMPEAQITEQQNVNDQQEIREIAQQLSMIRKKYDNTKSSNLKKKSLLQKLKKDIQRSSSILQQTQSDYQSIQSKCVSLSSTYEKTHQKLQQELFFKQSYTHVLNRMQRNKISMQIKMNLLQNQLKSTKHVLFCQTEEYRKIRQQRHQNKVTLDGIRNELQINKKRQNQRLFRIQKNVQVRREAAFRREQRQKRQAEIAEAAANSDKDTQQIKLKDSISLHKLWYVSLNKKLDMEIQKAVDLEDTFQKIRTTTGLVDTKDIVERFVTREQTYRDMQNAVTSAQTKLQLLREENTQARKQLDRIYVEEGGVNRHSVGEIQKKEEHLENISKQFQNQREKLIKARKVQEQAFIWGQKLSTVLGISQEGKEQNVTQMFQSIQQKVNELVQFIKENSEVSKQAIERYRRKGIQDVVEEINTPDAVSKLKRIRPGNLFDISDEELPAQRAESLEPARKTRKIKPSIKKSHKRYSSANMTSQLNSLIHRCQTFKGEQNSQDNLLKKLQSQKRPLIKTQKQPLNLESDQFDLQNRCSTQNPVKNRSDFSLETNKIWQHVLKGRFPMLKQDSIKFTYQNLKTNLASELKKSKRKFGVRLRPENERLRTDPMRSPINQKSVLKKVREIRKNQYLHALKTVFFSNLIKKISISNKKRHSTRSAVRKQRVKFNTHKAQPLEFVQKEKRRASQAIKQEPQKIYLDRRDTLYNIKVSNILFKQHEKLNLKNRRKYRLESESNSVDEVQEY